MFLLAFYPTFIKCCLECHPSVYIHGNFNKVVAHKRPGKILTVFFESEISKPVTRLGYFLMELTWLPVVWIKGH